MEKKFKLYQYTSLETLAIILKNKNIRLTKLNLLDDPLEKYIHLISLTDRGMMNVEKKNFGGFCFVSCWIKKDEESIAMWDMYGDRKRGVRICLPSDMLDCNYNIYETNKKRMKTKLLFTGDKPSFPIPNLIEIDYKTIDKFTFSKNTISGINIDSLGKYKIPDWSFQEECRFRIFASNESQRGNVFFSSPDFITKQNISFNKPISKNSLFFKLDDTALSHIEITVGPEISDGNRVLLEALLEKYNIDKKNVHNSKYTDE